MCLFTLKETYQKGGNLTDPGIIILGCVEISVFHYLTFSTHYQIVLHGFGKS